MAFNRTSFNLDNEYQSKFAYLLSQTKAENNGDLIKKFIDSYVVLTQEDEQTLNNFIDKTTYNRNNFFKEAIEYYLSKKVKQYNKTEKNIIRKPDEELKKIIDEMINKYEQSNFENKRYININLINNYLRENKLGSKNISVIKRVLNTYQSIRDYHDKYNLKLSHNIDVAILKRNKKYKVENA